MTMARRAASVVLAGMSVFLSAVILMTNAVAAEPNAFEPAMPHPLWDGQESSAQYGQRTGLAPTKVVELGNGVSLELVLIPAGKFLMGTPEPTTVDEAGLSKKILIAKIVVAIGGSALVLLLGILLVRSIIKRQRPQYSLVWLVATVLVSGIGLLGGLHLWNCMGIRSKAMGEYTAALERYQVADDSEKPAHWVTLREPFYMSKYEVTQEQYELVMGTNPSQLVGETLPVEFVPWNEACEFCVKTGERIGLTVRLPTEAEWEYACRAGTNSNFHTGETDGDLARAGWCQWNIGNTETHVVGKKEPNAWGCYDMHGNVQEWVEDSWHEDYRNAPQDGRVWRGPGEAHVVRGGCYWSQSTHCRSTYRCGAPSNERFCFRGFRVVVVIADPHVVAQRDSEQTK